MVLGIFLVAYISIRPGGERGVSSSESEIYETKWIWLILGRWFRKSRVYGPYPGFSAPFWRLKFEGRPLSVKNLVFSIYLRSSHWLKWNLVLIFCKEMSTDKYWEILILILICKLDRVKGQIIMLAEKIGRGFGLWKITSKEISLTPYNTIYTHFRAIVAGWRYLTTPPSPSGNDGPLL